MTVTVYLGNVASAALGGIATASSEDTPNFPASAVNDDDATGSPWGAGGVWRDTTSAVFDDWVQVTFAEIYDIDHIEVFGVQDDYLSPSLPSWSLTSTLYGLVDFDVQYWTGSAWATVPGGAITGNTMVWVDLTFASVTTDKIRVLIHSTQDGTTSQVAEIRAWTALNYTSTAVATPAVTVDVELSGSGAGWTNITADAVVARGLTIRHGIQGSGPADRVASTGTATLTLNNSPRNSGGLLGYYSLYHANKRAGWALGIGCRISLLDPETSLVYTRMVGRIDAIDPAPGTHRERLVTVTVVDWMDEAARWALTPEIGEQILKRGDQILTAILAQMPRQPTATSFDAGYDAYPFALDTSTSGQQPALVEFSKLAASEFGYIYQRANGVLRYEGRHTRLLNTTSAWTLAETEFVGLTMPSSRADILNTVRVTVHPKFVDANPTTIVYTQTNTIEMASGTTKMLLGPYRNPVTGDPIGATAIQPLIAGTDYLANDRLDGTGTSLTANFAITVTAGASGARFSVTNGSGSLGFLTTLHLRGKGIYDRGTVTAEAKNASSITANGEHAVVFDMPYQESDDVAIGAANYLLNKYGSAFAQALTITVIAHTTTQLTQVLARDISDRLTITETMTGLSSSFFINGMELRILPTQHLQATYTLAPAADPFAGLYWILGSSVLGTNSIPAPF